jgi:peptidoglycan/LPS O-acetylase OafA/YrhL
VDGIRFVAIAGVVLFHIHHAMLDAGGGVVGEAPVDRALSFLLVHGCLGVELFFILSGFILALPFIEQFMAGGAPVRLGAYYLRRLTRLEPPYLACLVLFFVAAAVLGDDIGHGSHLGQFLLRAVYGYGLVHNQHSLLNGVTWSLEIEVQFYLLVPVLVQVFRLGACLRRCLLLALILVLSAAPFHETRLHFTVLNFLQFFLAGFLAADIFRHHLHDRQQVLRPMFDTAALGLAGVGLALAAYNGGVLLRGALPVLGGCFVLAVFRGPVLNRLLTNKALCIIGGACYTIYLYHYPLISFLTRRIDAFWPGGFTAGRFVAHCVVVVPVVGAVALVMFVFIERPCMDRQWPRKLWRRITAGRDVRPGSSDAVCLSKKNGDL